MTVARQIASSDLNGLSPVGGIAITPGTVNKTVGSGGDYSTLAAAISDIGNNVYPATQTVNLTILDGTYTVTSQQVISWVFGRNINIAGQNTYSKSLSSIQSSSGSAGAWSLVLNLNSVANIAVGDYAGFSGLSGGSNPSYLAGAWAVTNVDAVNTRITVSSTHRNATAPSGAVAGTVTIFKTVLKFNGCNGFLIWSNSCLLIDKVAIVGDGTGTFNGVSCDDGGRLYIATALAICGFSSVGLVAMKNCHVNGGTNVKIFSSSNATGVQAVTGGVIDFPTGIISSGNSGIGVQAKNPASGLNILSSVITGNGGNQVYAIDAGAIDVQSATISGGASGVVWTSGGYVNYTSATISGMTVNNVSVTSSLISTTVAGLPGATAGVMAVVTDGDAGLAWGATVVNSGAGATTYLVWRNGSAWTVIGK